MTWGCTSSVSLSFRTFQMLYNKMKSGKHAVLNILGTDLKVCSLKPRTGYNRSGLCGDVKGDVGTHVVCAEMDQDFLDFTKSKGNDLVTPSQNFPGLKPGDHWCVCALRWKEAFDNGKAPVLIQNATHQSAKKYLSANEMNLFD